MSPKPAAIRSVLVKHLQLDRGPFIAPIGRTAPWGYYQWQASWIWPEGTHAEEPVVFCSYLSLDISEEQAVRIHVTADQRYELYVDGLRIVRGPEASDINHWIFASLELRIPAGRHSFAARVWYPGNLAGASQASYRPGFLCAAEGPLASAINTGTAPWNVRKMPGYQFTRPPMSSIAPPRLHVDTALLDQTWASGKGRGWSAPVKGQRGQIPWHTDLMPGWVLHPALLPVQREERVVWGNIRWAQAGAADTTDIIDMTQNDASLLANAKQWLSGVGSLIVPANTRYRLLVDAEAYRCAYPYLTVRGGKGASLSMQWAESLYKGEPQGDEWQKSLWSKGNRNEISGKWFQGFGDVWQLDGRGHVLESAYWHAGRYIMLDICTKNDPLTLTSAELIQTGYPLDLTISFSCNDPVVTDLPKTLWATLRACAHETYMDCPYYERLMYVGDTRLESLTTYVGNRDCLLPRKALKLFDWSRMSTGLTSSRYPTRMRQTIPPFSLWWIGMVLDYALWRDDPATVRECMPGVRSVLDAFCQKCGDNGLLRPMEGWNFSDWVKEWENGLSQGDADGCSGLLNWQFVLALGYAIELENIFGEQEFCALWQRRRAETMRGLDAFWDDKRGLYAEDHAHQHFSEHGQCLAILSGILDESRVHILATGLAKDAPLYRTTIYYSHYLFEALTSIGRTDLLCKRLDLWKGLHAQGFVTTPEQPEPSRSDCHGWGAHPLYHLFASILGIRPAGAGFSSVIIKPQLGDLTWAKGTMVHPLGEITVDIRKDGDRLRGRIIVPQSVSALFVQGEEKIAVDGNYSL